MLWIILALIISYITGSFPTAYLAGKFLKGIDIRKFGSGNVGATNALRVLGKPAGIIVLFIDVLKGALPVILFGDFIAARTIFLDPDSLRFILGISCILGHNWTIFLNFKGGKGVATTFGVLIGLAFRITDFTLILAAMFLIWLLIFILFRIVSIASVTSAFFLPLLIFFFKRSPSLVTLSTIIAIFIIFKHKLNIKRVFQGKEPRLNLK